MPDSAQRHVWLRLGRELPDGGAEALGRRFPEVDFFAGDDPGEAETVEAIFTNKPLPDEVTLCLPALKWIHTSYGGGNLFRTPLVIERGVTVTCSRGVQTVPLAEFTEACVLALAKDFPAMWRGKQEHRWEGTFSLRTLPGQVVGLLGLGHLGSMVAERLNAHGMRVRAIRRNTDEVPSYVEEVSGWEGLPNLLAEADFLIIAVPAEELQSRVAKAELRMMKPTAYLINLVSRGITPDADLAQALSEGWIAGAACNAFETNPLPADSPLWDADNLIISPNVAGQGDTRRWDKLCDIFATNLDSYLKGTRMMNVVDGENVY